MPRRAGWRTRAALVASMVAPVALAGAQATEASWTLASPVIPPGATYSYFSSVSCPSASFCMAVGTDDIGGTIGSLAEQWNGSSWVIESTPALHTAGLFGVSCRSATLCTAVGEYYHGYGFVTLAERWNGTSWTVQSTPNPPGSPTNSVALTSVDCTAASSCMAMGGTFAEHWNGTKWKLLTVPVTLTSVSCVTGASCVAVGDTYASPTAPPTAPAGTGPAGPPRPRRCRPDRTTGSSTECPARRRAPAPR